MGKSLLDQIESEALNGDVVKALRLCITLGGKSGSAEIREWASLELRGYSLEDDLPSYRRIVAPIYVDHHNSVWRVTGEEISVFDLPDFARDVVTRDLNLRRPITELRDMVESAGRNGKTIKLAPPSAADLVRYLNQSGKYGSVITKLYWQVSPVTVNGVVDRVCTDIIGLVSEIRAGMNRDEKVPSPDLASQAFNVVVHGDRNRVHVKNTQTSDSKMPDKNRTKRILQVLASIAGIITAGIFLWQTFG